MKSSSERFIYWSIHYIYMPALTGARQGSSLYVVSAQTPDYVYTSISM